MGSEVRELAAVAHVDEWHWAGPRRPHWLSSASRDSGPDPVATRVMFLLALLHR